jgi:hypothetical protein
MAAEPTDVRSKYTTGHVRAVIIFMGIQSMREAFQSKSPDILIPVGKPMAKADKVKKLPVAAKVKKSQADAKLIQEKSGELAVVDIGEPKKTSYGVVFTGRPTARFCWHCRREPPADSKIGIPIYLRDDRFNHILFVDIEGCACHEGCCYTFLKDKQRENVCYINRLTILGQIHEILLPGTAIIPAPSWRSLKSMEGDMTDEQFDKNQKKWSPVPVLVFRLCDMSYATS